MNNQPETCQRCGKVEEGQFVERGMFYNGDSFICECCADETRHEYKKCRKCEEVRVAADLGDYDCNWCMD